MARQITAVNTATDTFQTWVNRTNQIITIVNTEVVTVNSSIGVTAGNGFVNGIFGANTLVATTLRGGNVTTNAVLTISTNTNVTGTRFSVGNSTVNTAIVGSNITISNSTVNYTIVLPTAAQRSNPNFVLSANGGWVIVSSVSGSNTFIQFNDNGVLGSVNTFVFHKTNNTIVVGNSTVNTTISPSTVSIGNTLIVRAISANGSNGTSGQVLTSNGTSTYWSTFTLPSTPPFGGGSDKAFYENDNIINTNYTIATNRNAGTFGPITINSGVTVTIPSGSRWVIV